MGRIWRRRKFKVAVLIVFGVMALSAVALWKAIFYVPPVPPRPTQLHVAGDSIERLRAELRRLWDVYKRGGSADFELAVHEKDATRYLNASAILQPVFFSKAVRYMEVFFNRQKMDTRAVCGLGSLTQIGVTQSPESGVRSSGAEGQRGHPPSAIRHPPSEHGERLVYLSSDIRPLVLRPARNFISAEPLNLRVGRVPLPHALIDEIVDRVVAHVGRRDQWIPATIKEVKLEGGWLRVRGHVGPKNAPVTDEEKRQAQTFFGMLERFLNE